MKHNKTITSLLLGFASLSLSLSAKAEGNIEVHHAITASDATSISVSFTIDNPTTQDLTSVSLVPSGSEFSYGENTSSISIGDLFANSQITVDWTPSIEISASYLQAGLPLFFHLTAVNTAGQNIDIPVYSLGVAQ